MTGTVQQPIDSGHEPTASDTVAITTHEPRLRPWWRRRWRTVVGAAILLLCGGSVAYYYVFNNVPLHSRAWLAARIDRALEDGLTYLYENGSFGCLVGEGGESPPHHFFLEQVLNLENHAGLRGQTARARELNADNWEWRAFMGVPGWPRPSLSALDRENIKYAVTNSPDNYYAAWLLHSLYPRWTVLPPGEHERLFLTTRGLKHSYHLSHALMTYLWLRESAPDIAAQRFVDRLIRRVSRRLEHHQTWDARTGDIYNERVAFRLYMPEGLPVRRRWIERIVLSRNADGGWTYVLSIPRTIKQMLGLQDTSSASDSHATLMALYALAKYREQEWRIANSE